jgi:hypothetical protein
MNDYECEELYLLVDFQVSLGRKIGFFHQTYNQKIAKSCYFPNAHTPCVKGGVPCACVFSSAIMHCFGAPLGLQTTHMGLSGPVFFWSFWKVSFLELFSGLGIESFYLVLTL